MMIPTALLLLAATASAAPASSFVAAPAPKLAIVDYYGSACPAGRGLDFTIGPVDEETNIASLAFKVPNLRPGPSGDFGSLRMCSFIANLTIEAGYKVTVNKRGTLASGYAEMAEDTKMGLRGTYQFRDNYEVQSVGMLNVDGPVTGKFEKLLEPNEGDAGIVSGCGGGQLDIEFQSRSISDRPFEPPEDFPMDPPPMRFHRRQSNETMWVMTTDMEVTKCE